MLAKSQDAIGWQATLTGKISKLAQQRQQKYFRQIGSNRLVLIWSAQLAEKLSKLTHHQWLYRCNVVHSNDMDSLNRDSRRELKKKMRSQYDKGMVGLDDSDRALLESSFDSLWSQSSAQKMLWLRDVMVARGISPGRNLLTPRTWAQRTDDMRIKELEDSILAKQRET